MKLPKETMSLGPVLGTVIGIQETDNPDETKIVLQDKDDSDWTSRTDTYVNVKPADSEVVKTQAYILNTMPDNVRVLITTNALIEVGDRFMKS